MINPAKKNIEQPITVFEHQTIRVKKDIDESALKALQEHYGEKGVPYFSLTHNGIRFNQYVGVIQVGSTVIEVLPKADKSQIGSGPDEDREHWRKLLIGMLRAVGDLDVYAPSSSALRLQHNSILHHYFELFIREVEYLYHAGLVKKYRQTEGNVTALKGSLLFSKHIRQNLVHQERFYVRHTTYDVEHMLHFVLYKTIKLLKHINTNVNLQSRIGALLLYFPEMPDIKVSESTFENIIYNRKTLSYKKAIDIAKLLLLKYHPDVRGGRNHVLALMFDMNRLWEKFVYVSLRKYSGAHVSAQLSKDFWRPYNGYTSKIRPDIVIIKDTKECIVLDTKWKNLAGYNPSLDDLRQMYVYHEYFGAKQVALVYPGAKGSKGVKGSYVPIPPDNLQKECSLIYLPVPEDWNLKSWQESISKHLLGNSKEDAT